MFLLMANFSGQAQHCWYVTSSCARNNIMIYFIRRPLIYKGSEDPETFVQTLMKKTESLGPFEVAKPVNDFLQGYANLF